jgi:hypothetical protein
LTVDHDLAAAMRRRADEARAMTDLAADSWLPADVEDALARARELVAVLERALREPGARP